MLQLRTNNGFQKGHLVKVKNNIYVITTSHFSKRFFYQSIELDILQRSNIWDIAVLLPCKEIKYNFTFCLSQKVFNGNNKFYYLSNGKQKKIKIKNIVINKYGYIPIEYKNKIANGDSGSPVYNENKQVLGIISYIEDNIIYIVPSFIIQHVINNNSHKLFNILFSYCPLDKTSMMQYFHLCGLYIRRSGNSLLKGDIVLQINNIPVNIDGSLMVNNIKLDINIYIMLNFTSDFDLVILRNNEKKIIRLKNEEAHYILYKGSYFKVFNNAIFHDGKEIKEIEGKSNFNMKTLLRLCKKKDKLLIIYLNREVVII